MQMEKLYITQYEFETYLEVMIEFIATLQPIDVVVGIERGGIHLSRPIAKALKVPHQRVHISRYHGIKMTIENIDFVGGENVLVVDDVIDGGNTIETFHDHFGPAKVATMYWNEDYPSNKPDFYMYPKNSKQWIVFPWEKQDD